MTRLLIFAALGLVFVATGCTSLLGPPKLNVIALNKTNRELNEAEVQFGAHGFKWGYLVKNANKAVVLFPHPITPQAVVLWTDNGTPHKVKLDLRGIYPPRASGELTFTFYEDRVVPSFAKF